MLNCFCYTKIIITQPKNKFTKTISQINKVIPQIFVLMLLVVSTACGVGFSDSGAATAPVVAPDSPAGPMLTSVVTIGDSIGTGFGIATPWPTILASAVGVPLVNNSVSGDQTGFGLRVIEGLLAEHQPSHVVILLGTNDALRGSVGNAIANLQAMVDIAQRNNVVAIVGTLPPITRSSSENQRTAEISMGIRGLSGASIAAVRGAFGDDDSLIADGIHPNDAGQQRIAQAFRDQF
jgi:acyl-CoA thioesterase-1